MKSLLFVFAVAAAAAATPAIGQSSSDAVVRIVDVGPGLCVVVAVPDGHAMLYDAGRPGATRCVEAARELVPGRRFDLVVLSHSDNDHVGTMRAMFAERTTSRRRGAPRLPSEFQAGTIIHPGDPRGTTVTAMRVQAIDYQRRRGARVINLREEGPATSSPVIRPGDSFPVGAGRATFVAGWGDGDQTRGPGEDEFDEPGPRNNALSIVIRFEYGGHSVLLTGDTVGRMIGDPPATCAYAERIMWENRARVPLRSDAVIGHHHGADNSSSSCFAEAVRPTFVVFSAGHEYKHPTQSAVDRWMRSGRVSLANILRTDRGDNEGSFEMTAGSGRCPDPIGDDDVEIRLPRSATAPVTAAYRGPSRRCPR